MRQAALNLIFEMSLVDSRVVFIGSDLGAGTLKNMKSEVPERFFMEGIAEQYMVGFAAGLSKEGFIPFLNTIGTFLTRRAYEQIMIDVCLHNLPVRILGSGGGMVYAPLGPTHTSVDDFSLMLNIPNLKVFAPADANEMKSILESSLHDNSPYYIRIGKGGEKIVTDLETKNPDKPKIFGQMQSRVIICTTGVLLQHALKASEMLKSKEIETSVIHFPCLSEIDLAELKSMLQSASLILVAEEHIPRGGLFTQILESMHANGISILNLRNLALPFSFIHKYGSQNEHLIEYKLDSNGMYTFIVENLNTL
jgi:transketolase